ncbi:MAG: hypothetical protein JNM80_13040 [Phycisphaerae bacterium]|nr:hypothetical protein [Phycisphaerae bacterium]
MPPLPRLRIAALDDLARQLRFASSSALRRQVERAEALAADIDDDRNYPEDWLVHRLTGYRPETEAPAVFVGRALRAELSALVERLSDAARLRASDHGPPGWLTAGELAERWRVSRKSLERYRRLGLVARRVREADGRARLAFARREVERFERAHAERLGRAARLSRLGEDAEARIVDRARAYARCGLSLNQAATRLARRHGRAPETIRRLLLRRAAGEFARRGPPTARERALVERAWFLGIEPGEVAARLGRSRAAVARVALLARARRLREALGESGPSADEAGAVEPALPAGVAIGAPAARTIGALLGEAEGMPPMAATVERALARRMSWLVARAGAIARADGPTATGVDRAETDLREAARIKAVLVRAQLPLLRRTLLATLGRPIEEHRTADVVAWVREGIDAIAQAVEGFDATGAGRLAAPAGLALARRLARAAEGAGRSTRATPRLDVEAGIEDWTRKVARWQTWHGRTWLEPSERVRRGASALGARERGVLEARYGWGRAPATIAAIAGMLGTTVIKAALLERRARREAWRAGA